MSAPAGWHGQADGRERFWDGTQWTDQFRDPAHSPVAHPLPAQPVKPVRPWYKKKRFVIPGALLVLGIIGSALPDAPDNTAPVSAATASKSSAPAATTTSSEPTPSATSSAHAPSASSPAPASKAPTPSSSAPPKPKPAAPVETRSQANARAKAADYLEYTAFSRKGLIAQLSYEGFSSKDATYGVDALKVNWSKQAAKKAEEYLDYTSFSRSGLVQQLKFEGFTASQAEYGAKSTGL